VIIVGGRKAKPTKKRRKHCRNLVDRKPGNISYYMQRKLRRQKRGE
jgi:hypothetical protein